MCVRVLIHQDAVHELACSYTRHSCSQIQRPQGKVAQPAVVRGHTDFCVHGLSRLA